MANLCVFVCENFPSSLRGEMTQWLLEIKAGVFVGKLSARVRSKLWERIQELCNKYPKGNAFLLSPAKNEQKFEIQYFGKGKSPIEEFEGISLIVSSRTAPKLHYNKSKSSEKPKDNSLNKDNSTPESKQKSYNKKKAKIPKWKILFDPVIQQYELNRPIWTPKEFPLNFLERVVEIQFKPLTHSLDNRTDNYTDNSLKQAYNYSWNGCSGYWAVSPDQLWPKEAISLVENFCSEILSQTSIAQKKFLTSFKNIDNNQIEKSNVGNINEKKKNLNLSKNKWNLFGQQIFQAYKRGENSFFINCIDIETTTYLPKALEGFVYVIGIVQLEIPLKEVLASEQNFEINKPKIIIKQVFNMTRGKERSPQLIQCIKEILCQGSLLLVFNQEFDIKILQTIQNQNNGRDYFTMPIFDLAQHFESIIKLEEHLLAYFPNLRRNTNKAELKEYYNLFKGEGTPRGIRRFEPLGRYNLADLFSPLLMFLSKCNELDKK